MSVLVANTTLKKVQKNTTPNINSMVIPEYATRNNITVTEFIDKYAVPEFISKNKSYDKEVYRIENIKKKIGELHLKDVSNKIINEYYNELL